MALETPQFGGLLGGWLAAEDRREQMAQRARQTAAYNALVGEFGPMAGDPVAYGQLAGIRRNEEAHPLEQQARGLANDTVGETLRQSRELFPATMDRARLGNTQLAQTIDQSAQAFPLEQQARVANVDSAQLGNVVTRVGLGDADRQRNIAALGRGVQLLAAVRDNGGDLAYAFDKLLPALGQMGIPSDQIAQARTSIINDPSTIDQIAAALGGQTIGPDGKLVRTSGRGAGNQSQTEAEKYYERSLGKEASKAEADVYERKAANDRALIMTNDAARDINGAVDNLLGEADNAFGWSAIGRNLYSSDYADAAARLDGLKSKIMLNMVQMLKDASKTGATGLGALSDTEGRILTDALGSLKLEQSPESARKALADIKARIQQIVERTKQTVSEDNANAKKKAEELYSRMDARAGKGSGGSSSGGSSSGPSGYALDDTGVLSQPEGTVVEDENGTRYVVRGGQLVPQ